jgi:hypothetical protein
VHTVHYRARLPIQCAEYMLSVSELDTVLLLRLGSGRWGWPGTHGPCRSRGPNQEESEPIRIARRVRVETAVAGLPDRGPRCWPAPAPDSDGVSQCLCGPTAMRTRVRSSCGRAGRGLERAPRQPQMSMTAMVVIPPRLGATHLAPDRTQGSAVCAYGHRDRTGHHDNTPPPAEPSGG